MCYFEAPQLFQSYEILSKTKYFPFRFEPKTKFVTISSKMSARCACSFFSVIYADFSDSSWPLIETITARGYSCLPAKTGCTLDFDQTNFRISHWSSPPRHCRSCSCIRSSESRTSCGFLKTEQRFARTIWTSNGKSGRVLRRATMTLKSFHHVG